MGTVRDANAGRNAVVYGTTKGVPVTPAYVPVSGGMEYVAEDGSSGDIFGDDTPLACDTDSVEVCEACD